MSGIQKGLGSWEARSQSSIRMPPLPVSPHDRVLLCASTRSAASVPLLSSCSGLQLLPSFIICPCISSPRVQWGFWGGWQTHRYLGTSEAEHNTLESLRALVTESPSKHSSVHQIFTVGQRSVGSSVPCSVDSWLMHRRKGRATLLRGCEPSV